MTNTRQLIKEFNLAFNRPVNELPPILTDEERILLGSLLMEECFEYVTKGLGLRVCVHVDRLVHEPLSNPQLDGMKYMFFNWDAVGFSPRRDAGVDLHECADGLSDVNVVVHFNAHWQGMNLDALTEETNGSNMSKLDESGQPIINGITEGYKEGQDGYDPTKPIGKILKGPNFRKPNLEPIIWAGNY